MRWIILISLLICLQNTSCTPQKAVQLIPPTPFSERPKNIILMIGDGMGLAQISAAMYNNDNQTVFDYFPIIGLQKTHSSSDLITDSAASATAIATGQKTYNNAIGMSMDELPLPTILEEAEARKLATGLITTTTIVHATPASFAAHELNRVFYENIAKDYLELDIDVLIGGGERYFSRRDDGIDLTKKMRQNNYQVYSYFTNNLSNIRANPNKNFAFFTADDKPVAAINGRDYLEYAAQFAPKFLNSRSEEGFFLMIEGGQIDWGGHAKNEDFVLEEMKDFERAILQVLEFAAQDGETLVIVTADHETGGMAIAKKSKMNKLKIDFTTNGHTAQMVPVFAFGPQAELFQGIYDNTDIYSKMRAAYNWGTVDSGQ